MDKKRLRLAENALKQIAMRDGKTTAEVRREIQKVMFVGMCSQDPKVQAYWKRIPCDGDVPTPEEVIVFLADEVRNGGTMIAATRGCVIKIGRISQKSRMRKRSGVLLITSSLLLICAFGIFGR